MTTRFPALSRATLASLAAAAIALTGVGVAAPAAAAEPLPPLVITEVMQDNAGTPGDQDYFEFFEVTNTTGTAVDLADYRLQYNGAAFIEAVEQGTTTALADAVIPAGGTAVFWLRYAVGSGDAAVTQWQLGEADFRAHFGDAASTYPLFHAVGQAGFANSGARTLRLFQSDGTTLVSGSEYNRAATNRGNADHFRMPESGIVLTDPTAAIPTPGTILPEQLVRPASEPEPEPTDPPEPEPTDPAEPSEPGPGASGNAGEYFPLVITEIYGDNPGTDLYEFVEVTNTTMEPIDLTAAGIGLRYHTSQWNAGSAQPFVHLDGEDDTPVVIGAGMSAVFWLNYAEGSAQRGMTKEQFRTAVGADPSTPVYRFGPQAGIANGGDRGFSLVDAEGTVLSRAWAPVDTDPAGNWNAQFAVPGTIGSVDAILVEAGPAVATSAGTVMLAQVTSALSRPTDPTLAAPLLQITELAPDTANVGGGDAYEFVEVYNASDAAIDFGDYTLSYLYTDNALGGPVTLSSTLWPAQPADVTIEPGATLVLWVKNPAGIAAGLTVADFNTAFGTGLVLGEDIVELYNGGMANGGSRGIQVRTNTGHDISRAYYFADDQTTASTAIQYGWNPSVAAPLWTPPTPAGAVQTMIGLAAPTPGAVSADQVPAAFVAAPVAGSAPVITDLTGSSDVPDTADLDLGFDVTDDVLVRSVTLSLTDNLGATETRSLGFDAANRYYYSIPAADLFGKRWVDYTLTASDGSQESVLGPVRVDLVEGEPDAVRLNLVEGQFLGGQTRVTATADSGTAPELTIDGAPVAAPTRSLETGPVFAFEATSTDAFFRNGVKLGDDVLRIFDEGYYSRIVTVDATVPVERVVPGEPLTLTIVAGTKAWPEADVNENNDDFVGMNLRLALPDGRVLRPEFCATTKEQAGAVTAPAFVECPAPDARIAFSDANLVSFLATFTIPDDAFSSVSTVWDTTAVADGAHVVEARTAAATTARTVQVDNTAPVIESPLVEGERYRGQVAVDATATDAGSGVSSLTATLDGDPISLPLATSSLALAPGEHVAEFTATDAVGNTGTRTVTFETVDEQPAIVLDGPTDGEIIEGDSVDLTATPSSPEEDALDLSFREGYRYAPGDTELTVTTGTVTDSATADRSAGVVLGADDLQKILGTDGVNVETTSASALPYQLFTVAAPEGAGPGSLARVDWRGSANSDAKVTLYARTVDGAWETVDQVLTTDDAPTDFTLEALVPVDGHVVEGRLTFLVQHSEGFAATDLSTRDSPVDPFHPDATARSEYDFTIAIESDTQYYNETPEYYTHQLAIHRFLREERANLNLQYLIHNGDIVNVHTQPQQWANADAAYRELDEAGLPYGVLAGNHDVGGFEADYTQYSQFFGEARFAGNPWYGGSYKDNRGHYDLVSVGGVDFLFLYMGWPTPNDVADNTADIAWMNEVIRQFPERKVWVNLHEYMLTTGGLGPFPQRVFDEVVAANPNVFAVSSGHYHDAYTRTDDFDDDGDGVTDRTVYSMLFDYQGLPEGGQGYLRLAHFDNDGGKILFRTYSPSLRDFDSDDPSLNDPPGMQQFEIPYAAVGIAPQAKTLATDSFQVEILTANEIAAVPGAASGEPTTVTWRGLSEGEHGWYVIAEGPFGGIQYSALRSFSTVPGQTDPGDGDPGDGDPGDGDPGDGDPGDGDPGDGDPGDGDPGDGDPGDGETVEPSGTVTAAFGSALIPGGRMQVDFTGFQPGEEVRFVLHSDPIALGETLVVGADGTLSGVLAIPADAAAGVHRLEAIGASGLSIMSDPFTISTPTAAGDGVLPFTGVDVAPTLLTAIVLLLIGAGVLIVVVRRRRSVSR